MKYFILYARAESFPKAIEKLETLVNESAAAGSKPHGGITVYTDPVEVSIFQPMIKPGERLHAKFQPAPRSTVAFSCQ